MTAWDRDAPCRSCRDAQQTRRPMDVHPRPRPGYLPHARTPVPLFRSRLARTTCRADFQHEGPARKGSAHGGHARGAPSEQSRPSPLVPGCCSKSGNDCPSACPADCRPMTAPQQLLKVVAAPGGQRCKMQGRHAAAGGSPSARRPGSLGERRSAPPIPPCTSPPAGAAGRRPALMATQALVCAGPQAVHARAGLRRLGSRKSGRPITSSGTAIAPQGALRPLPEVEQTET